MIKLNSMHIIITISLSHRVNIKKAFPIAKNDFFDRQNVDVTLLIPKMWIFVTENILEIGNKVLF